MMNRWTLVTTLVLVTTSLGDQDTAISDPEETMEALEEPNVQKSKELELPCSHPGHIDHGLTDWNGTGREARFACYQGYYLVGPPKLVCRYGRWFSDAPADRPTCKPVVCGQPSIGHGSLATGDAVRYKAGGAAVVICDEGYQLRQSSNNKLVCREDGSWRSRAEFPVCAEKGCLYDDLVIQPPENGNVEVTGRRITYPDNDLSDVATGVYRPGSVLKYTCHPGHVVVPVVSATRVCRKGRWDGQGGACVRKTPRFQPRGSCPPPPLINNGYYLSERSSGEKPYVLPVSGHLRQQFEVGAIARYHCNEGYSLLRLFGQDIYRCSSSGVWYPKQPPVCISKTNNMEPLDDMMCLAPDDVAYASYRAVEGVVTPNGALHGTILEYTCNIGYRDTILPCLPSRRTCHAGTWVGSLPSCAPFEFCPPVPRIQNGYLATPREGNYRLHSIVKYGCDRGFWLAGEDTFQCEATGCWEPNALPKCIDENLISSWGEGQGGAASLWAVLVGVVTATALVSAVSAVCGVVVCRTRQQRRSLGHAPAPHWSTHVTVTPTVQTHNNNNNNSLVGGAKPGSVAGQPGDRMALMTFSDQEHGVLLPSYEEALREGVSSANGSGSANRRAEGPGYRHHGHTRPGGRHHPVQAEVQSHNVKLGGHYTRGGRGQRQRAEPEAESGGHGQCHHSRQQSGSNSGSLRSGSVQSVSTAGISEMTSASGQSGASNTGGEWATDCRGPEHVTPEVGPGLISEEENPDTLSAYSQSSTKSR